MPPWCFIPMTRQEIRTFRKGVSEFHATTEKLAFLVDKLESWAPQCSERERIETIQKEVNEINRKIDKILELLQGEE